MIKLASMLILATILLTENSLADFRREPGEGGMIITEWDLAFPDLETLESYTKKSHNKSTDLIVGTIGKKTFDIWNKTDRKKLTYCISDEFKGNKKDVIEAMDVATKDWMDIANVKFKYMKDQDAICNPHNQKVMFDVRPVNFGMYIARAFFPSYARAKRNVLIDATSFDYSFVAFSGFLRHELGHVLGFRHEHISKDGNQKCKEDSNFHPVTAYDQLSVMHYPQCGGKNILEDMILSKLDKEGAAKIYP